MGHSSEKLKDMGGRSKNATEPGWGGAHRHGGFWSGEKDPKQNGDGDIRCHSFSIRVK